MADVEALRAGIEHLRLLARDQADPDVLSAIAKLIRELKVLAGDLEDGRD